MLNSNTPYRGLLDSASSYNRNIEKENFEAFKQKKFKEIDEARGTKEPQDQRRKSILKPATLNLRNLAPTQQGPPTFDSEYEFRNLLIAQHPSRQSKQQSQTSMQYNLRLQSLTKQYQTKIKTQAERYELQIMKLSQVIESLKQQEHTTRGQGEREYCHLCSNGEVVSGLNKMLRSLEEAHKDCIVRENEASKKIIGLDRTVAELREDLSSGIAQRTILASKVASFEEQNRALKEELEKQRQKQQSQRSHPLSSHSINLERQQINPRHANTIAGEHSIYHHLNTRPSSTSVLHPREPSKRSSIPGFYMQQLRGKRQTPVDPYQRQLNAAKIIDRVKSNTMMGMEQRARAIQERKFNYS